MGAARPCPRLFRKRLSDHHRPLVGKESLLDGGPWLPRTLTPRSSVSTQDGGPWLPRTLTPRCGFRLTFLFLFICTLCLCFAFDTANPPHQQSKPPSLCSTVTKQFYANLLYSFRSSNNLKRVLVEAGIDDANLTFDLDKYLDGVYKDFNEAAVQLPYVSKLTRTQFEDVRNLFVVKGRRIVCYRTVQRYWVKQP